MIHNNNSKDLDLCMYFVDLSLFLFFENSHNIFPKNYNFLEKYISLCYTTGRLNYGENA